MNALTQMPDLSMDKDLKAALERANQVMKTSMEEMNLLKNAFNPMQTFVQINEQFMQFFSKTDWMGFFSQKNDPANIQSCMTDFLDVQSTSFKKLTESQQKLLIDSVKDISDSMTAFKAGASPQQNLAAVINKNLDGFEQIQKDVNAQASLMGSIQTAYVAWLQSTLEKTLPKK
ncbi:hypothetical protein [Sessilibacter sp. MAH2]